MRRLVLVSALLSLVACDQMGGPQPIDAQKFLSSLDGPKVPTIQDTLMESAKDAEKQGNYPRAVTLYQQVLDKKPEDKDAALGLANCARRVGDNDNAILIYDNLLKKFPTMPEALEGKGLALMGKGDFDSPAALFEEALKADPKRWKTLNALGILFTTRNMQPEAQQYFAEALKQNPGSASIYNNMGLSQALGHHFDEGIQNLKQASAIAADGTNERKRIDLNLALVYAIAGKLDDAHAIAERYYSGAVLDNNLGLYAHLANDDQLARTYLNMALTDSKVFYEKAWNNLQAIDKTHSNAPGTPAPGSPVVVSGDNATPSPSASPQKSKKVVLTPSED